MLQPQLIPKVAERFKALSDEARLRLLLRLREGERNVNDLAADLAMGQASVSKHLAVLKAVGLVEVRRLGTQAIYRIADRSIFDLCRSVCDGVLRHLRQEHAALGLGGATPSRTSTRRKKEI